MTDSVPEKISQFLRANFPQIQMHGGNAEVVNYDEETNIAHIRLGGACSGCGISPMTVQMIQQRLPAEIEEITEVTVDAGSSGDMTSLSDSISPDEKDVDAPF